jgi:hypothetical protein
MVTNFSSNNCIIALDSCINVEIYVIVLSWDRFKVFAAIFVLDYVFFHTFSRFGTQHYCSKKSHIYYMF